MPSGRHPELPAPRVHRTPPRRRPPPPVPPVSRNWDVGPVHDAAAIANLRANLNELAADFHDLAACLHDLRAEEHVQAVLHSFGDPIHHQLQADLRRTAAAAERASAQKERARARTVIRLTKIADVGRRGREDPQAKYAGQRGKGEVVGVEGRAAVGSASATPDATAPADVASTR